MSETQKTEQKERVWIMKERCKMCGKCVPVCIEKILVIQPDPESIYGQTIFIDRPDRCTGCSDCDNVCPDFAIFVAKKKDRVFPKRSKEAQERLAKISENKEQPLPKKEGENEKA
ncbi:MAG: 4Fe-4S dicluster domain-containing protein [Candidatus Paceibacterota bacterium]|jgi:2-oxoglutarate ferredoxin oxidoreductase subunit delta